jgi:hypothetical protein
VNSDPVDLLERDTSLVETKNAIINDAVYLELRVHNDDKPVILGKSWTGNSVRNMVDKLVEIAYFSTCLEHGRSCIGSVVCTYGGIKHVDPHIEVIFILRGFLEISRVKVVYLEVEIHIDNLCSWVAYFSHKYSNFFTCCNGTEIYNLYISRYGRIGGAT